MLPFLATVPWLALVASLLFLLRRRPRLQDYPATRRSGGAPRISVIVPTQNDATRIGLCLATLLNARYPHFEVIVVDHGSRDGTREIVEALRRRTHGRLRLIRTGPVPDGRAWRAWGCLRGCRESSSELLLFTEPGTIHHDELLDRAVSALEAEGADLLTVQPRLTMSGFWERLVMPHAWLMLRARFPSARLVNRSRSPRNSVAHHQFLLFRRETYEEVGGHAVVAPGEVEDLAVPQAVVAAGRRLFLVHGDRYLETRLFRTLAGIASDSTAAVPPASRSTVAPWAARFVPWLVAATPIAFFVLPPVVLLVGLLVSGGEGVVRWGAWTSGLSLLFWLVIYGVHRIRPAYAVIYPVGALATAVLFVRSILEHDRGE